MSIRHIESKGTQVRKVTRTDPNTGKRLATWEPLLPGYTTALVNGALQTVKKERVLETKATTQLPPLT